jgi:hypothetical protein
MDWEGMVHALEQSHRLLKPAGRLVDIHPLPDPPLLAVQRQGKLIFSEACPSEGTEAYRLADRAIDEAVQRRLFAREQSTVFDFRTYAPSVKALDEYLTMITAFDQEAPDPQAERLWADLFARAAQAAGAPALGLEVMLLERARMTSLRPLPG